MIIQIEVKEDSLYIDYVKHLAEKKGVDFTTYLLKLFNEAFRSHVLSEAAKASPAEQDAWFLDFTQRQKARKRTK